MTRSWHRVAVPHDFSIMDRPDGSAPVRSRIPSAARIRAICPAASAGIAGIWFSPPTEASRIVRLNFEAVYMDADIWVNGEHLKKHRYGYTAFSVDLTGKVRPGEQRHRRARRPCRPVFALVCRLGADQAGRLGAPRSGPHRARKRLRLHPGGEPKTEAWSR